MDKTFQLRKEARRLKIRLTVKHGKRRVYKKNKVLRQQIRKKKKADVFKFGGCTHGPGGACNAPDCIASNDNITLYIKTFSSQIENLYK